MDDALFLKTARAQIEASGRLDLPASFTADHALRLLEMAERWQAHEELCRAAAVGRIARAAFHHLARAKAAEEARDLAIAERDGALGRILQSDMDRHYVKKLWAKLGAVLEPGDDESMIEAAERITAQINDARTILGALDGQALSERAKWIMACLRRRRSRWRRGGKARAGG